MKRMVWAGLVCGLVVATSIQTAEAAETVNERYRPKLFKQFGDHVNTPDG